MYNQYFNTFLVNIKEMLLIMTKSAFIHICLSQGKKKQIKYCKSNH